MNYQRDRERMLVLFDRFHAEQAGNKWAAWRAPDGSLRAGWIVDWDFTPTVDVEQRYPDQGGVVPLHPDAVVPCQRWIEQDGPAPDPPPWQPWRPATVAAGRKQAAAAKRANLERRGGGLSVVSIPTTGRVAPLAGDGWAPDADDAAVAAAQRLLGGSWW